MEQFIYNLLIQYIMMYYKGALVFSITICCLNLIAGKLCVFYKAKNTAILFFFAIYVYAVLAVTILSRAGTYISEVNLRPLANFYKSEWERGFFIQISYCSSQCPSFCIPSIQRSAIFINAYCLVL